MRNACADPQRGETETVTVMLPKTVTEAKIWEWI